MTYRILTALLLVAVSLPLFAGGVIVVPNEFSDVEASGANSAPWNSSNCEGGLEHYQLMYASNQLTAGEITQLAYRRNGTGVIPSAQTLDFDDVVIIMSTLATSVEEPSNTFDTNIGPDAITVYDGPLTMTLGLPTVDSPQPFDMVVPLQRAFSYDPAQGGLLVDISLGGCADGDHFLFMDTAEDSDVIARVAPFPAGGETGSVAHDGAVTQFEYGVVDLLSPGYSGSWWFGSDRNGEGLLIEIITIGATRIILVYWFTYDDDGDQMWLFGTAEIIGSGAMELNMFVTSGPSFGPGYDADLFLTDLWGVLVLTFFDCFNGEASFDSLDFGSGTYAIFRVTTITGLLCE